MTDLIKLNSQYKWSEIKSDFNFLSSWIIPLSQFTIVSYFTFADTITDLILSDLIAIIKHHTAITSHTIPIINEVFHFMFTKLYHEIWIPRCFQLSLVKKTFNINSHNKRSKYNSFIHDNLKQSHYKWLASTKWINWYTDTSQFRFSWKDHINTSWLFSPFFIFFSLLYRSLNRDRISFIVLEEKRSEAST